MIRIIYRRRRHWYSSGFLAHPTYKLAALALLGAMAEMEQELQELKNLP